MGILELLFNLLIFSFPLGAVFRIHLSPNVYLYIQDVFVGLIFIIFLKNIILKRGSFSLTSVAKPLIAFLIISLISLLINSIHLTTGQIIISFLYLLRFASYISLIFVFQFLNKGFRKTLYSKLIISSTVVVVLGFIQYFYYPNLRNLYYLGWDDHLYRLFSVFLDPNFAGAFISLSTLLVLDKLIKSFNEKKMRYVILYLSIACSFLFALLLTYSRSGFIAFTLGVLVLLIAYKMYKYLVAAFAVLIIAFFAFSNFNTEGLNPFRIASTEARIGSISESFIIFSKNPVFGVGFNAYRYAQVRYGTRTAQGALTSNADAGTDNSFLFVLATTGILGFFAYLVFWIKILAFLMKKSAKNATFGLATASCVSIIADSLFINSFFYIFTMGWLFILLGFTLSKKH